MFTYAVLRLTPRALNSGPTSRSAIRKENAAAQTATNPNLVNSSTIPEQNNVSNDNTPVGSPRHQFSRPLQNGKWFREKDGFLVNNASGVKVDTTPTVCLNQTERMYLCAYQQKNLTILLLVPTSSILDSEQVLSGVKKQLIEDVCF